MTRYLIFIFPLLFETMTPAIHHLSELMQSADLVILPLSQSLLLHSAVGRLLNDSNLSKHFVAIKSLFCFSSYCSAVP